MRGRWEIRGRRALYASPWVALELARVRLPDGTEFDHHVVRVPAPAVAVYVRRQGHVLAIHRHRFIGDFSGWELPCGRLEPGETPEAGAVRECLEETGWRPLAPSPPLSCRPAPGLLDLVHHVVACDGAELVGEPVDSHESDRVEWLAEDGLLDLVRSGAMPDGYSQYAVLAARAGLLQPL